MLDANVLLDLYRVLPDIRSEQLDAFRKVGNRLWIPHRVGQEFHERRFNAIRDQATLFKNALDDLEDLRKQGKSSLERLRDACGAPNDEFSETIKALDQTITDISTKVRSLRDSSDISVASALRDDHILRAVDDILDGKVGPPLHEHGMAQLTKDAEVRFTEKIPPGYCDAQKDPSRAIGDLVLWEQILKQAESNPRTIIFISRENKEDWVRRDREFRLGPRPELVAEMRKRAGVDFYLLRPNEFLSLAQEHLGAKVSKETLEAVAQSAGSTPNSASHSPGKKVSIARAKSLDELLAKVRSDDTDSSHIFAEAKDLILLREECRREVAAIGHEIQFIKSKQKQLRELSKKSHLAEQARGELSELSASLAVAQARAREEHNRLHSVDTDIEYFRQGLEIHLNSAANPSRS
ncbi:PIN-like domain-containing protein [Streptomyces sp. NPDC088354]|uniref:PIN-like domain-containing protein n=1 Tax=Streptomyces sp. NPDC088354 TaxID=3365856 RepID=UPI0037F355E1